MCSSDLLSLISTGCVGVGSKGLFGTGVSVALDPRTVGTQIDDSIMQKTISAKILTRDKKHIISVKTKVLDGRIFITGKVDNPEEKLLITKLAWETKGARSVRNDIKIKEEFDFKQSAKDLLITSQLRTALIVNKNIKTNGDNRQDKFVHYRGKVHCCRIDNGGIIYIRRNGKVMWSGNSRHSLLCRKASCPINLGS